jgi:hypothetical protein
MAMQHIGQLVIPPGGTDSNALTVDDFGRCESLCILNTESALTGVCSIEIGNAREATAFATLESPPGTDVVIAADTAIVLNRPAFPSLRIHSAAAEAPGRTFVVWGYVRG